MFGLDIEPGAQSANREVRRLAGVIDRLRALPDDEHLTVQRRAPYTPTALDIAFQPAVPEDDKQLPAPIRWPSATPLTQRTLGVGGYGTVLCATIDGAEAATIIELMAGHDEDTPPHWSTGATPGVRTTHRGAGDGERAIARSIRLRHGRSRPGNVASCCRRATSGRGTRRSGSLERPLPGRPVHHRRRPGTLASPSAPRPSPTSTCVDRAALGPAGSRDFRSVRSVRGVGEPPR